MTRLLDVAFKGLQALMVVLLAAMVVMVFGNVVLRYLFDSGIDVSEEMSRFLFVWLTFIGAVVVARENAHLGIETLVIHLGEFGRKLCMVLSDLFVLLCCTIFFWGTYQQAGINASNIAPITGISMIWVYGVGFFTSICIGIMAIARILRVAMGTLDPAELRGFAGEMEDDEGHKLKEHLE
jgi:TRAP-type C4-dicarboxylate transport system permease small subunit